MSAIAGIIASSGALLGRIDGMVALQTARGPDAQNVVRLGSTAIGHAANHTTAASKRESQPLRHDQSGCVVTADIRIDNRADLISLLAPPSHALVGDAELALLAYLRWGPSFASHLLGDFAIAVWDPREARLTLVRDHIGVRPITYTASQEAFVFASTLEAVVAGSPGVHPPNVEKLHHYLVEPLEAAKAQDTPLSGIHRLPAAHYLTWRTGEDPRLHRYWRLEASTELQLASDQDYNEALNEVLDESVRCRLQHAGPTATLFSGGLDSSAVLAAALTSATPRNQLPVYAAVEEDTSRPGSDAPHIKAVLSHFDHLAELRGVSIREAVTAYDFDRILRDPDGLFDSNMTFLWAITQAAGAAEHRVMLTGLGGDELLYLSPILHSHRLLRQRKVMAAANQMVRKEGTWQLPTSHLRHVLSQSLPDALVTRLRSVRRRRHRDNDGLTASGLYAADRQRLLDQRAELLADPEWNTRNSRVNNIRRPFVPVGLERYDRVGARSGVEMRHPMLDVRFVEFCVSLPAEQLVRNGWTKFILRSAASTLPHDVAWRPKSFVAQGVYWSALFDEYRDRHSVTAPPALPPVFGPMPPRVGSSAQDADMATWNRAVVHDWYKTHRTATNIA